MTVLDAGAVAGFPCFWRMVLFTGAARVCLSVRAWLCVRWRVRVARLVCARAVVRLVSGGVFCYARRGVPARLFACRLCAAARLCVCLLRFVLLVGYCVVCVS